MTRTQIRDKNITRLPFAVFVEYVSTNFKVAIIFADEAGLPCGKWKQTPVTKEEDMCF